MPKKVENPGRRRNRFADCLDGNAWLFDWEELNCYFEDKAAVDNRANQFRRNSGGQAGGRPAQYAEAFQSIFPRTVDML